MKKAFAAIFVLAVMLLLLSGCIETEPLQGENNGLKQAGEPESNLLPTLDAPGENADLNAEISLSVSTGKEEYGSHEEAVITVIATASEGIESAVVKIWGVAPYSKNYIESEKTVDLNEGENLIEFVETTPYCTAGCGGVYPGPYDLHASVEANGKELAGAKTTITLASH